MVKGKSREKEGRETQEDQVQVTPYKSKRLNHEPSSDNNSVLRLKPQYKQDEQSIAINKKIQETINMYEKMKEEANSLEEARVIGQTIKTLKKQLRSIERSRKNYSKNKKPRAPPKYKRIRRNNQKNPRRN